MHRGEPSQLAGRAAVAPWWDGDHHPVANLLDTLWAVCLFPHFEKSYKYVCVCVPTSECPLGPPVGVGTGRACSGVLMLPSNTD